MTPMEVLVEVQDMFNDVAAGILEITSTEDNEMHRISSEHAANDMFAINSKATCFSEEVALHIKNPHAGARLSPSPPLFAAFPGFSGTYAGSTVPALLFYDRMDLRAKREAASTIADLDQLIRMASIRHKHVSRSKVWETRALPAANVPSET